MFDFTFQDLLKSFRQRFTLEERRRMIREMISQLTDEERTFISQCLQEIRTQHV